MGLDSAAQGFTPVGIVGDMNALKAKLIGLYFFNNDVPNPASVVKPASFVQQVEQLYGGPCVLPIMTIRTGDSPDPNFLVQDLLLWFPQRGRRVAIDLEQTAFPSVDEVARLRQAFHDAGFSLGGYGFQSTQDAYAAAGLEWRWGVQAYAEGFDYLPPGYSMWQWTDNILNGNYDGNTVDDNFSVVSSTFQPPVITKEKDMFIFNGPDGVGYLVCALGLVPLPDLDTANQFTAQGVPWLKLDQAGHDAILAAAAAHSAGLQGKVSGALSVSGTLTAS